MPQLTNFLTEQKYISRSQQKAAGGLNYAVQNCLSSVRHTFRHKLYGKPETEFKKHFRLPCITLVETFAQLFKIAKLLAAKTCGEFFVERGKAIEIARIPFTESVVPLLSENFKKPSKRRIFHNLYPPYFYYTAHYCGQSSKIDHNSGNILIWKNLPKD